MVVMPSGEMGRQKPVQRFVKQIGYGFGSGVTGLLHTYFLLNSGNNTFYTTKNTESAAVQANSHTQLSNDSKMEALDFGSHMKNVHCQCHFEYDNNMKSCLPK